METLWLRPQRNWMRKGALEFQSKSGKPPRSEGSYVSIKAKGKTIIIEPAEPVADKYYGAFKVEKWPVDMDEFTSEVMQIRWKQRGT